MISEALSLYRFWRDVPSNPSLPTLHAISLVDPCQLSYLCQTKALQASSIEAEPVGASVVRLAQESLLHYSFVVSADNQLQRARICFMILTVSAATREPFLRKAKIRLVLDPCQSSTAVERYTANQIASTDPAFFF